MITAGAGDVGGVAGVEAACPFRYSRAISLYLEASASLDGTPFRDRTSTISAASSMG